MSDLTPSTLSCILISSSHQDDPAWMSDLLVFLWRTLDTFFEEHGLFSHKSHFWSHMTAKKKKSNSLAPPGYDTKVETITPKDSET